MRVVTESSEIKNINVTLYIVERSLSGLENGLLGLNSGVNAVVWSRNVQNVENMDIICFGHLLYEMCAGYELNEPQPSVRNLELDLEKYPQVSRASTISNQTNTPHA